MINIASLQVRSYLHIDKLDIDAGKMVAICGPNGAGKSTLLEALAGYLPIQQGVIRFAGESLRDYSVAELATKRSWLPQQAGRRVYLSVFEQLLLTAEQFAPSHRQSPLCRQVIDDVVQRLALQPLVGRTLMALSGGELQRVAMANLLVSCDHRLNPDHQLILLDEPFSALDPHYQHQVIAVLLELKKQGRTVLLALHDLNLAVFYAMDVLLLDQGRLKMYGPAQQVLSSQQLAELFGVSMTQISINGRTQLVLA
ncbi:ABC transporter ATP-binding protein [Celerinatantimonas yamalensis]|uniref:ABC transporter ATP-binding protein n=1 Tax=Celerinatantimonas yamalensis TaxID=559956 RepID=A0ABW9G487_9GAMM